MSFPAYRFIVATTAACILAFGCSRENKTDPSSAANSSALTRVVIQLDWIPEPEHGGFYQALARGYFEEVGLDVKLLPGGANAFGMQKLASGQADIAQSDSTNTILAIHAGAPIVQVGAVFQNDPSVLMLHADSPVKTFEDLQGRVIMARPEWALIPYLKKKYGIDFNIIPQNFSVANFIANKEFIQQGFYIAEPYHIIKGGAQPPRFLYAWDAGFDAYTVLAANRAWARANGPQLKAFLAAYIRGWRDYIEGDPSPAHALMKRDNPQNTDTFLAFSRQMIIDEKLVVGRGQAGSDHIGLISRERFQIQIEQLESLGILPRGTVSADSVMTLDYLPGSIPQDH
jgi:NitT/TauT family transport system substrate-binding protein